MFYSYVQYTLWLLSFVIVSAQQSTSNAVILRDSAVILTKKCTLPQKLEENSGLEYQQQALWFINDSNTGNYLYRANTKGEILQTITVANAPNIDWEDLASDDQFLYLADTGNNLGDRTDLTIYIVALEGIEHKNSVDAQRITFDYAGRTNIAREPYQHDYDCEAIFVHGDSIHLLTKAWETGITSHHILPKKPGHYLTRYLERLDTQGLITTVDIQDNQVNALQYTSTGEASYWQFTLNDKGLLFAQTIRSTYLGETATLGQLEGLTIVDDTTTYISGEQLDDIPPTLYKITVK